MLRAVVILTEGGRSLELDVLAALSSNMDAAVRTPQQHPAAGADPNQALLLFWAELMEM